MLSKTDFLLYLEAPMHLWAKAHGRLEETTHSPYEQHLMQQGQQVETLAYDYLQQFLQPNYSKLQLFWQPTYNDDLFVVRPDALVLDQDTASYDLYEIKSATSVQTAHEYDLTFQVLLLETLLKLRRVNIIHIDKTYQHGHELDLTRFFTIKELSDTIEMRRGDVEKWRHEAQAVAQMEKPQPKFACHKPQSCPCPSLCHPDLPNNPVYNIPYIGKKAIELQEMGITAIEDIPPAFNLTINQQKHFQAVKSGKPIIDHEAIQESMASLSFPLYFLDYETFNAAIPLFPGYHPYEHIVFQYSLFVVNEPGAQPQHAEYLLTTSQDPAPRIVPHLLAKIGSVGSVVVWNQSFEANRNKDLAAHVPECGEQLIRINDRLFDLMRIFKDGHYVHPDFKGSASLKAVLPVMCPNLQYKELTISDGTQAMLAWYRLQQEDILKEEREIIEADMRNYCKLDTYGMVVIWQALNAL